MSAFLVTLAHIDAMVTFAADAGMRIEVPGDAGLMEDGSDLRLDATVSADATAIGQILLQENARSLAARYGDDDSEAARGFALAESYEFRRFTGELSPAIVTSLCDCFDYQACEADSWTMSLAEWLSLRIRAAAARAMAKTTHGGRQIWSLDAYANLARPEGDEMPAPAAAPAPAGLKARLVLATVDGAPAPESPAKAPPANEPAPADTDPLPAAIDALAAAGAALAGLEPGDAPTTDAERDAILPGFAAFRHAKLAAASAAKESTPVASPPAPARRTRKAGGSPTA